MGMPGRKFTAGTGYRYGFNGKEKSDEVYGEGNAYDFGARVQDSRLGKWLSIDPDAHLYPGNSTYSYALNTPISAIDPDGKLVIFIGGLRMWQASADQLRYKSKNKDARPGIYKDDATLKGYWRTNKNSFGRIAKMDEAFINKIGDNKAWYASGSSHWTSKAKQRVEEGKEKAQQFHAMVQSGQITLEKDETIKIVCHSQGGAHAAGFAEQLMSYKDTEGKPIYKIEVIYYITPHQPTEFTNPAGVRGVQYSHPLDAVASDDPFWLPNGGSEFGQIRGISEFDGRDIMYEENFITPWHSKDQIPTTGAPGNRGGHNVEDNDFIFDIPAKTPGYIEPRKDKKVDETKKKHKGGSQ